MLELTTTPESAVLPITEAIISPITSLTNKTLQEAIDVVFFSKDPQATQMEKGRKHREFQLNKFGIVQFSDHVTSTTRQDRDIISRVQERYDELISIQK